MILAAVIAFFLMPLLGALCLLAQWIIEDRREARKPLPDNVIRYTGHWGGTR